MNRILNTFCSPLTLSKLYIMFRCQSVAIEVFQVSSYKYRNIFFGLEPGRIPYRFPSIHKDTQRIDTYGSESHDFKKPDSESEIEDDDDHECEDQRIQTPFPPTVDA